MTLLDKHIEVLEDLQDAELDYNWSLVLQLDEILARLDKSEEILAEYWDIITYLGDI